MAGSLIKLDTATASSSASVSLTGITSAYNTCVVYWVDVLAATDGADLMARFEESGSANTNSNYNGAVGYPRSDRSFIDNNNDNLGLGDRDKMGLTGSTSNTANRGHHGSMYVTLAANGSESTFAQLKNVYLSSGGTAVMLGNFGGWVLREGTTVDGVQLFFDTGNIAQGDFVLYGIKK